MPPEETVLVPLNWQPPLLDEDVAQNCEETLEAAKALLEDWAKGWHKLGHQDGKPSI